MWDVILEKNVTGELLYNTLQSMLREISLYEKAFLQQKKASDVIGHLQEKR